MGSLGDLLNNLAGTYSKIQEDVTGVGLAVTLETNLFPPIDLIGQPSGISQWLTNILQPTVRINGNVVYAPSGPADPKTGSLMVWVLIVGGLAGVAGILRLVKR